MKIVSLLVAAVLVFAISSSAMAQDVKRTATITNVQGAVDVMTREKTWKPAAVGMVLNQSDVIRTKIKSSATLDIDGTGETATVIVKESSQLMLADLTMNKSDTSQKTLLDLALGEILIKAKKIHSDKTTFEVKTPTSIVAVRGTTFSVSVETVE
jgi:hypothetical protein